jgi:hypothetical protein
LAHYAGGTERFPQGAATAGAHAFPHAPARLAETPRTTDACSTRCSVAVSTSRLGSNALHELRALTTRWNTALSPGDTHSSVRNRPPGGTVSGSTSVASPRVGTCCSAGVGDSGRHTEPPTRRASPHPLKRTAAAIAGEALGVAAMVAGPPPPPPRLPLCCMARSGTACTPCPLSFLTLHTVLLYMCPRAVHSTDLVRGAPPAALHLDSSGRGKARRARRPPCVVGCTCGVWCPVFVLRMRR